jgi:hypothetical protein
VLGLIAIIILLLIYLWYPNLIPKMFEDAREAGSAPEACLDQIMAGSCLPKSWSLKAQNRIKNSSGVLKILIGFWQVMGSFPEVYAVEWPQSVLGFWKFMSSLVQIDVLKFPGVACLTANVSFTARLLYSTCLVPTVGLVLLLPPIYTWLTRKGHKQAAVLDENARSVPKITRPDNKEDQTVMTHFKSWPNLMFEKRHAGPGHSSGNFSGSVPSFSPASQEKTDQLQVKDLLARRWDAFGYTLLLIMNATYPAISRTILSTFACTNLGVDGSWLRSDIRVSCPHSHDFAFVWAVIFSMLIPAGFPVLMILALYYFGVPRLAVSMRFGALLSAIHSECEKERGKIKQLAMAPTFRKNEQKDPAIQLFEYFAGENDHLSPKAADIFDTALDSRILSEEKALIAECSRGYLWKLYKKYAKREAVPAKRQDTIVALRVFTAWAWGRWKKCGGGEEGEWTSFNIYTSRVDMAEQLVMLNESELMGLATWYASR